MRIGTDASCSARDRGFAVCSPPVAEQRDEPVLRVVIADDHTMVRSGLRMLLDMETDLEVVAEAGDIAATTACLHEHAPDVLILDVHLGAENGLDAMASLLDASPASRAPRSASRPEPRRSPSWAFAPRRRCSCR